MLFASPRMRFVRLLGAVALLFILAVAGSRTVRADGTEQPVITNAYPNAPGAVTIAWFHSGDGVALFVVEEQSQGVVANLDASVRTFTLLNLQPSTTYHLRVCAVYDANRVCSDDNGVGYTAVTTMPPAQSDSTHGPTPAITSAQADDTSITITWTAFGHGYTKYYINYEAQADPGAPRNHVYTNEDDDAGDHGTWKITGLVAATKWLISVQGCDFSFIQDICYDWSPPYPVTTAGRKGDEWRTRWQQLDDNPGTAELCADGNTVYQRWSGGNIWQYTGTPKAWMQLDDNPGTAQIACGGGHLYQRHGDGEIWQYTGKACDAAGTCLGWQELDDNPGTASIAAGNSLYQLHATGEIYQYTGKPCDAAGTCLGWQELDDNPGTTQIAAAGGHLYQRHGNGELWWYTGKACDAAGTCLGWQPLDDNPATIGMAAGGDDLFQLHNNGEVWKHLR